MTLAALPLIDTHCHLDFEWFDADRAAMIDRALAAGVQKMIIPGLELETLEGVLALADAYPEVYAAVGVHPNSGESWTSDTIEKLRAFAQHPKVVAIGEIGLDYYWDKTPVVKQKEILVAQLALAAELALPVIIHNREATDDVLSILLAWQAELENSNSALAKKPGVLHSYSGNIKQAQAFLDAGFYLGFTGPVTFKKADELREVVAGVPLDRILIETDAPFLTPHPYRGKRNEPAYVQHVAEKVSQVKQIETSELARMTTENATRLFRW